MRLHPLMILAALPLAACSLLEQRPKEEHAGTEEAAQTEGDAGVETVTPGTIPTDENGVIKVGPAPRKIGETVPTPSPTPAPAEDAGAPAPKVNPWTKAVPYSLLTPAEESSDHHLGAKHQGDDCMSCHTGAGAPKFALAGTVFTTSAGTTGAPRVQVRVVSPDGEELALVGTDSNGNFWLKDAPDLPTGSWVGIRDESTARSMSSTIGGGQTGCNTSNCHSTSRPLHLRD